MAFKPKSKGAQAVKGLKSQGGPPAKLAKQPGDPIKGLKDSIKAKQIQALAMEAALQSGGGIR